MKKRKKQLIIVFIFLFVFELVTFYQMTANNSSVLTISVEALSIIASIIMFLLIVTFKSDTDEKIKEAEQTILDVKESLSKKESQIEGLSHALNTKTEFVNKVSDFLVKVQEAPDLSTLGNDVIQALAQSIDACQGVFYKVDDIKKPSAFQLVGSYAFHAEEGKTISFNEGLIGQAASEKKVQVFVDVPEDYIEVKSGLGDSSKVNLILVPVVNSGSTVGMLELASFHDYSEDDRSFLEHVASSLGTKMITLK